MVDMAQVVDSMLYILGLLEGWDSTGNYYLFCLFVQGLPTYTPAMDAIAGMEEDLKILMKADPGRQESL